MFGAPLYNSADTLPEALESLLSQTEARLAVVLVDDGSSDATPEVAASYAALDERITYRRNERRLGLVGNWRRTLEIATELFPEVPYFAWASDHDVWHPRWLATVTAELDRSPEVVLAFTANERIDASGDVLHLRHRAAYDSRRHDDAGRRLRAACRELVAGDAVYGLARVPALRRAGPFRHVLEPDRLLVRSLAVHGHVVEVPETLWYRRIVSPYSRGRQRAAFFMDGTPLHAPLPAPLVHAGLFAWDLGVRGVARPAVPRRQALVLAGTYLWHATAHALEPPPGKSLTKRRRRARKRVDRRRDQLRRARRSTAKRIRRPVRRARRLGGGLANRLRAAGPGL